MVAPAPWRSDVPAGPSGGSITRDASGPRLPGNLACMESRRHPHSPGFAKRVACGVGGGLLLVIGVALLVLPGPGLLLVLAGLLVLANGFPRVQKFVAPVERRAMQAAEESVSSPLRMVFSIGTGVVLIAAGVVWWVVRSLPLSGWPTGASLILSGLILLGVLVVSYRHVRSRSAAGAGATTTASTSA
jgi:Putative transmembrane protein (PGPGW)